jgi:hypothetical protein
LCLGLQTAAESILSDPRFSDEVGLLFVVRDATRPSLVCFGDFNAAIEERLDHLSEQLALIQEGARHIGYDEAEQLVETLGDLLVARYGRTELRKFAYRPIPRGGLIVLGMLSYVLDLRPDNMDSTGTDPAVPVVVVDDCVISGMRLRRTLQQITGPAIVASLLAPTGLVEEVLAEKKVDSFIRVAELYDLAPGLHGSDYEQWREEWRTRRGDSVFWIGRPEHISFAWTEPESTFLNRATGELEPGFHLAAASRCLRHRHHGDRADRVAPIEVIRRPTGLAGEDRIQVHRNGPGPLNAPDSVVAARISETRIAVADFAAVTEDEAAECYLLDGSAARMWSHVTTEGTVEAAVEAMTVEYETDRAVIEKDLSAFVDHLLSLGLLISA